nr:hypothetical protein [Tanacetum cinerariifolium]
MTPEQQAFFESQQAAFVSFQQDFQNRQQNPPQIEMPQQQSQSSNSLSQTETQLKKGRMKRTAKKEKSSEHIGDVTLRWTSDEETLLSECFVAVSEDRNVDRSQPRDTLWFRVLNEFERKNFQKRTKDMLSSKCSTLNHNCQKFNVIYKRCIRLKKSGENEVDLINGLGAFIKTRIKIARLITKKHGRFLRKHTKWDAPDPAPIDLTEDENVLDEHFFAVNTDELFGPDARPRHPAAKKAFEASKDKDRTITRLEELRFLALSMKDLSPDDACWIDLQKKQIKEKLRAQMPRNSNNQTDDSDE